MRWLSNLCTWNWETTLQSSVAFWNVDWRLTSVQKGLLLTGQHFCACHLGTSGQSGEEGLGSNWQEKQTVTSLCTMQPCLPSLCYLNFWNWIPWLCELVSTRALLSLRVLGVESMLERTHGRILSLLGLGGVKGLMRSELEPFISGKIWSCFLGLFVSWAFHSGEVT